MKTSGNVMLITGGASGIGFALAEAFVKAGNRVIVCGRRENRLEEAKERLPQLITRACDIAREPERASLSRWAEANHPDLNVLVNNAGIQKMADLTKGAGDLLQGEDEIETDFRAPIYPSAHFAPLLSRQKEAAIVTVSSGLGFVPIAAMPVYCACKAGVHCFTVSLRHQLKGTAVKVFEVIPPMVDTDLGKGTTDEPQPGRRGMPPAEVAAALMRAWQKDEYEVVVGETRGLVEGSRANFDAVFQRLNRW